MHESVILQAVNVTKVFGGIPVVRGVDLDLRAGEVHALVGENGAGKSTFIKMLSGVHQPDGGQLIYEGRPVVLANPRVAHRLGVFTVHQEPALMPQLTVAENVLMGFHPYRKIGLKWVRYREMFEQAEGVFGRLGIAMDVRQTAANLTIAQQQMVELGKALVHRVRVLILDEPTATLSAHETDVLFQIVRQLRDEGAAILFVSHRLEEVFELSNRITVMRDGEKVGTFPASELDERRLVSLMVGRDVELGRRSGSRVRRDTPLLSVSNLTKRPYFSDVSFDVHPGEIVGMAGLVGAGRTNVAEAIFGVNPADSGSIAVEGRPVTLRSVRDAMQHGIVYVPEDRHKHGLALPLAICENIALPHLHRLSRYGVTRKKAEEALAAGMVKSLTIRTTSIRQRVSELSGGNQQKVVFGKWISHKPRIVVLDEPTRGVDVGAKSEIYYIVRELADAGAAVLLISSDLPELLSLSDRILVMRDGRLVAEVAAEEMSEENIMFHATGVSSRMAQG